MRAIIKVIIAVSVCFLIILGGCTQKDLGVLLKPDDVFEVKSLNTGKQTNFTDIKAEIEDYKAFNDEFFVMWLEHIEETSTELDVFNSSTILEEKIKHSQLLEKRYQEFKVDLESIRPPAIAAKAHSLAIETVSCRILFFKKFNEDTPIDEINELENQAYLTETNFWKEIDLIYEYFDEETEILNAEDDNKYLVFR